MKRKLKMSYYLCPMNYYQRLSDDELSKLEQDFIKFMVLNGITGEDWNKIKKNDTKEAEGFIHQFSTVVYESSLRKAKNLLWVEKKIVRSFQCLEDKIVMCVLEYKGEESFNFQEIDDLHSFLSSGFKGISILSVDKIYNKKREHEMYDMIQSGCKISDGQVFKLLAMYWAEVKGSSKSDQ